MNKYPTYKPSNIPWLGDVPEHWKEQRLSGIFSVNKNANSTLNEKNALQFRFGEIISKPRFEESPSWLETIMKYNIVSPNDIVINGLNLNYDFLTQRVAIVKTKGVITSAYISITPREFVNPNYYCYFLKTMDAKKIINGLGSGIRLTLDYSELKKQFLPLPPLPEQTQIVRYLDWQVSRIYKLLSAKKKQIALLKEQKQGVINYELKITNYEKIPLKRVCLINASISEKLKLYGSEDIVTFLPMEKISVDGKIDCSEKRKIQDVRSGFTSFAKNDVVIAKITPCFENGKGACLDELGTEIGFGTTEFIVLRAKEKLLPQYLYLITRTSDFRKQGEGAMTGSAGQKRVPTSFVANFQIAIPPISEQQAIVTYLDKATAKIDLAIANAEREIALFNEYRTRLISDVVTGKVDVREVVVPEYIEENREDSTFVGSSREEDDDYSNDENNNNND